MIGSSTAAGYGLPEADGSIMLTTNSNIDDDKPVNSWANRLRRYYNNLGLLHELDNFAIYGEDLYQAQADGFNPPSGQNWPDQNNNITRALSVNPDIILINFPSNGYDVLDAQTVMDLLHSLYQQAIANGHTVCYVCTTQPRTSDGFVPIDARMELKTLRDRIVAEFPANYIDFYTPVVDAAPESSPGVPNPNYLGILPQYAQGDGTHLNEA
ncbi:MAG TPA: SGNH/GDSL hydrolase family protein, partial [Puia sp.]|nr:SGNH/GDSL hydrolase family protein [Puia sp.]